MAEEKDSEKGDFFFFLGILLHIWKVEVLPCPSFLFGGECLLYMLLQLAGLALK